ncbi:MAG: ATP-binding protein [Brevinematales bacterium]|nr:ATP-binding protein [Brevinematales bacterium]
MFDSKLISAILKDYISKFPAKDKESLTLEIDDSSIVISLVGDIHSLRIINVLINVIFKNVDIQNTDQFLVFDLCLAIEESLINIFKHSYPDNRGQVELRVKFEPDKIVIRVSDYGAKGRSFNYDEQLKKTPESEFSESGRGMMIIKKIIDDIKYSTDNDRNTLLLIKKWKG